MASARELCLSNKSFKMTRFVTVFQTICQVVLLSFGLNLVKWIWINNPSLLNAQECSWRMMIWWTVKCLLMFLKFYFKKFVSFFKWVLLKDYSVFIFIVGLIILRTFIRQLYQARELRMTWYQCIKMSVG